MIQEIPLSAEPQTFTIQLGAKQYKVTLAWRETLNGGWVIDIADAAGVALIMGIPLITGADLLAQYSYLQFPGELYVQSDSNPDAVPTFGNLGAESHLYFVSE